MSEFDPKKELEDIRNFTPPSVETAVQFTAPMRAWLTPAFRGMENIDPTTPALFVTNHTVYGLVDGPLLVAEIYKETGVYLRGLTDNLHFRVPGWRELLTNFAGNVRGSRENCEALMAKGDNIMVFPGGSREICKKKGEEHTLTWKKRTGFVRMAIKGGYPIVPVSVLGGDDAFDIYWDADDIKDSAVGKFLEDTGIMGKYLKNGEWLLPVGRGLGLSMIPKPVKLYHFIGEPISTEAFEGKENDEEVLWELRNQVEAVMYRQFEELKEIRKNDTEIPFWKKILLNL